MKNDKDIICTHCAEQIELNIRGNFVHSDTGSVYCEPEVPIAEPKDANLNAEYNVSTVKTLSEVDKLLENVLLEMIDIMQRTIRLGNFVESRDLAEIIAILHPEFDNNVANNSIKCSSSTEKT